MPIDSTTALNKNVVTRKQLIGIANFVRRNSEAVMLSRGTEILSTEQEIRTTKKAQVFMPLMTDIQKVSNVLAQAKAGSVTSKEVSINEFIVNLANESIVGPIIWRPRDGEVISASSLMSRLSGSYQITSQVAKDRVYYANIVAQGKAGVDVAVGGTKLKSEIVASKLKTADADEDTADKVKNNATIFANQIRKAIARIQSHKDKLLQSSIADEDIAIVTTTAGKRILANDARYNMYDQTPINKNGALDVNVSGRFDGSPVIVSKQLPAEIDFIVMLFGAATSVFAIRNKMNMDKVPGVDAYLSSMEFDEGTGVWLPHMITIGTNNVTTHPAQTAVGFEAYDLPMDLSSTVSGNKGGTAGLPAPTTTGTKTKAAPAPKPEPIKTTRKK